MGATLPQLYSPRLLIVSRLKSGTAKTVPAVLAAPALTTDLATFLHMVIKKPNTRTRG